MFAFDRNQSGLRRAVAFASACALAAANLPVMAPAVSATAGPATTAPVTDPGWPREVTGKDGTRLVYYQPQIDSWKNYRELQARVAVSVTPPGGKPSVGVASVKARTQADVDKRLVLIKDIEVTDTRFPSLDAAGDEKMGELVRKVLPNKAVTISLDRLTASVERSEQTKPAAGVKSDPPRIFVSKGASILLMVDGDPVLVPVENTTLQFVVNTNWDVFTTKDKTAYYLLNGNVWLTSAKLEGPWALAKTLPADFTKIPATEGWQDVKSAVPPKAAAGTRPPQVFFSSQPAEVLSFTGEPVYAPITGTRLVYAKNTDSDLFVQSDQQQYYYLVSGRWFRANSLDGPWTYTGGDLPADFLKIPENHPKARVLASVPGTQEAADAVLLAQVPTTVLVNRAEAEAKVKVAYDGAPQFKPIETTSLQYAVNTQDKVIQVAATYYVCYQGVWFLSSSPQGPWKTADTIPVEIYKIPPSSPVYNVTYVTVANPTTTTVECSHTSGYLGMFVIGAAVGLTIAYGSGYYYPPYYYYGRYPYPIYRPYPYTYGYGAAYNPYTGGYAATSRVYGPYGMAGSSAWYNPATGRYGRSATVQTPYGGRTAARWYNPYTGTYAATRQGSSPYAQWGSTAVQRGDDWARTQHVTTSQGTVRHASTSNGGSATSVNGKNGNGGFVAQGANNNVYAGKDGNVYKRSEGGGWSQYQNGGWNSVNTSGAQAKAEQARASRPATTSARPSTTSSDVMGGLNREAQRRQRGAQRTSSAGTYDRSSGARSATRRR